MAPTKGDMLRCALSHVMMQDCSKDDTNASGRRYRGTGSDSGEDLARCCFQIQASDPGGKVYDIMTV